MMKKMKNAGVLFVVMGIPSIVAAQVKISGEVRPRTEFRHGFKSLLPEKADPAFFTEQRTRIKLNYVSDQFITRISLQDVRIWGAVDQVYKSDPSLTGIHEAFAAYKINPYATIGAGRTELNYDNARILGNLAWAQQSRSHDLALFTYQDSTFSVHAGAAFNQDSKTAEPSKLTSTYYSGVSNYKTMQFLWIHKDFDQYGLSFLALNNGLQTGVPDSSDVEFSQTAGFYGVKSKGDLKGSVEAYYQTGKDGKEKDLSAYLLALSLTYPLGKIPVTLGVDHLSGTKASSKDDHSFNPFYGTNHKFYGYMDYFYVGNPHKNAGLTDIFGTAKFPLLKNTSLSTSVHQFLTSVDVLNSTGEKMSRNLGTEVDLLLNVGLAENVALECGYSQMFATKTLEVVKGFETAKTANINNWAYVMITFTPVFFSK